jgi:hypothetical protein
MRTNTNLYILNLALADILMCLCEYHLYAGNTM